MVTSLQEEMKLHLGYCAEFGLSKEDVEKHEESQGGYHIGLLLFLFD